MAGSAVDPVVNNFSKGKAKEYLEQLESGDTERLKNQIKFAKKDVSNHEKARELLIKELSIAEREYKLLQEADNARLLKPVHKFQELDEYWTIQKEYRDIQWARKLQEQEMHLSQLDKVLEAKKAELARLEEEVEQDE